MSFLLHHSRKHINIWLFFFFLYRLCGDHSLRQFSDLFDRIGFGSQIVGQPGHAVHADIWAKEQIAPIFRVSHMFNQAVDILLRFLRTPEKQPGLLCLSQFSGRKRNGRSQKEADRSG